ncbi:MAG: hypothetical protein CVT67_02235 [Actinobacteria bacterium HGW-Actinobacteria-7]|nr:MAG: hypothetical protein CVT67_02235 [Actinobacteria bacterium HGW-Actinobacteria-7]
MKRTSIPTRFRVSVLVVIFGLVAAAYAVLPRQASVAGAVSTQAVDGVVVSGAGKVLPPANGAYLGVFEPDAPFDMSALDTYASVSSRTPAIVMWFQAWDPSGNSSFDASACADILARGSVPLITWEPWNPGADANYVVNPALQSQYSLAKINSGKYDSYIRSWARGVKSVEGPVMIRPLHEMNGTWYPWGGTVNGNSPAAFRAAWIRIHKIFANEGATNVTWVWSINHASVPNTYQNRYAAYYPGSAYVDWTSISGFNWGTSRPGFKWRVFSQIFNAPLTYLIDPKGPRKPIILTEFGTATNGGDKPGWIRSSYGSIKARPYIDAVVYYDKREVGLKGEQDWQITTSWQAWLAYRKATGDPYFVAGVLPTPTVEATASPGATPAP